jgi:hypothetical protein
LRFGYCTTKVKVVVWEFIPAADALMLTVYGTPVGVPGIVLVVPVPLPVAPLEPPLHDQTASSVTRIKQLKARLKRRRFLKAARTTRKITQTAMGRSFFPSMPKPLAGISEIVGAVVLMVTCVLPLPVTLEGTKPQLLRLPAGVMTHDEELKAIVPL